MPTEQSAMANQSIPVNAPLSLKELGAVLVKHYGLHDGLYEVMIEFQIGMGPVGPNPESFSPGAMIGVSRVGLMPAQVSGPTTLDAAKVNPKTMKKASGAPSKKKIPA